MTLEEYLKLHDLTPAAFGEKVGATRMTVWRWLQGEHLPSRTHMQKIMRITNGKVTANSFLSHQVAA